MIPTILRAADRVASWAAGQVIDVDHARAVYRVGALALEVHALRVEREHARDREQALTRDVARWREIAEGHQVEREAEIARHGLASWRAWRWKRVAQRLRAVRDIRFNVARTAVAERDRWEAEARAYAAQRDAARAQVVALETRLDGDGEADAGTLT